MLLGTKSCQYLISTHVQITMINGVGKLGSAQKLGLEAGMDMSKVSPCGSAGNTPDGGWAYLKFVQSVYLALRLLSSGCMASIVH